MVESLREKLEKKGWSKQEIDKTLNILEKADKDKRPALLALDKLVYWVALLLAIGGNFVISVVLIPIMLTMPPGALYLTITVLAIAFGMLFNLILVDVGELKKDRAVVAGVFIPAIAIINIYVVVNIANYISKSFELELIQNPFIVSFIYVVSFSLPYIIQKIRAKYR